MPDPHMPPTPLRWVPHAGRHGYAERLAMDFQEKGELRSMIARIWHGWTTPENADIYERLLREEIFTGIQNRHIRGFRSIQLLRREIDDSRIRHDHAVRFSGCCPRVCRRGLRGGSCAGESQGSALLF